MAADSGSSGKTSGSAELRTEGSAGEFEIKTQAEIEAVFAGLNPKLYYEWAVKGFKVTLIGGFRKRVFVASCREEILALTALMEEAGFLINLDSVPREKEGKNGKNDKL